jgi:hypothetical protein
MVLSGAAEADDCDCEDVELCKDEVFEVEVEIFDVVTEYGAVEEMLLDFEEPLVEVRNEDFPLLLALASDVVEEVFDERNVVFNVPALIDLGTSRR